MITVHEEAPGGGALPGVHKPSLNALRFLIRNDLDFAWHVDVLDAGSLSTKLVIKTDGGTCVRRTAYIGPPDEMRLLLGAVGWYQAHADDPSARSRQTAELFYGIGHELTNPAQLLAQLRERFEPFVNRVL